MKVPNWILGSWKLDSTRFCYLSWIKGIMFQACDPSGLAFNRILLGFIMLLDIVHERGLSRADQIWFDDDDKDPENPGLDPNFQQTDNLPGLCRFPLFPSMTKLSLSAMYAVYAGMVFGIVGVIVGYRYRISCALYSALYWYLFIIERSRWNNHSYLFGLLSLFNLTNDSHTKWSIDSIFLRKKNPNLEEPKNVQEELSTVPFWQYFIIRFQIFLLYFYAGVKKIDYDWLRGYSMVNLSKNPVFAPIKPLVSDYFIDYYLIHLGGFVFDLTVGFLFLCPLTRSLAFLLCAIFNLTNSQLFSIGMFPWSMLAIMPIFCSPDWPLRFVENLRQVLQRFSKLSSLNITSKVSSKIQQSNNKNTTNESISLKQLSILLLMTIYIVIQVLMPFSYLVLPGYNTWSNGMYGYSWDMMVHNWIHLHSTIEVKARVRAGCQGQCSIANRTDPHSNVWPATATSPRQVRLYLNPWQWTETNRWHHHSDMVKQFVDCVQYRLPSWVPELNIERIESIKLDVWTSLNGRFAQRMYDPNQNLLEAEWSPYRTSQWIMPIISHQRRWRSLHFDEIYRDLGTGHSYKFLEQFYANNSNALDFPMFIADFPGMKLENYIDPEFSEQDSWLVLIDGRLRVTIQLTAQNLTYPNPASRQFILTKPNDTVRMKSGSFVRIEVIAPGQAFYTLIYPKKRIIPVDDEDNDNVGGKCGQGSQRNRWIMSFKFIMLGLRYIVYELLFRQIILRLATTISQQLCSLSLIHPFQCISP